MVHCESPEMSVIELSKEGHHKHGRGKSCGDFGGASCAEQAQVIGSNALEGECEWEVGYVKVEG